MPQPPSDRTRVRRGADRGVYARGDVKEILDAGLIAHVGVATADGPLVLPMAFGTDDDKLYLHGAVANHLLGSGDGEEICVTVTHLDGLVMARTPFHNSMNYRSVVVRGLATKVEEHEAKLRALQIITDHVVENWDLGRPPTDLEVRKTSVLEMPLTEASAKVRSGDPVDETDDLDGPWWAGVVPLRTTFEAPRAAADLRSGSEVPPTISALEGRPADER